MLFCQPLTARSRHLAEPSQARTEKKNRQARNRTMSEEPNQYGGIIDSLERRIVSRVLRTALTNFVQGTQSFQFHRIFFWSLKETTPQN